MCCQSRALHWLDVHKISHIVALAMLNRGVDPSIDIRIWFYLTTSMVMIVMIFGGITAVPDGAISISVLQPPSNQPFVPIFPPICTAML